MRAKSILGAVVVAVLGSPCILFGQPQLAVTTSASTGGPTPAQLAGVIADPNGYTLGAAGFSIKNSGGSFSTDPRAIGTFTNGNILPGTSLNDPVDPNAVFSGGIGIATGVCLSTGFLSDSDPTRPTGIPSTLAVGVQGPNNGYPTDRPDPMVFPNHVPEGEASKVYRMVPVIDEDFEDVHSSLTPGGDAAVLEFEVQLSSPGFLRVSFAFGSDEYPAWVETNNDTLAILVKGPCTTEYESGENLAVFNHGGNYSNFSLLELTGCEDLFLTNQMSPESLAAYPNSSHRIPNGVEYYDHEFGGFSTVLTRETSTALAPGIYTIKFVIDDVGASNDRKVDSALFIKADSLKLYTLAHGDYNGDGIVDADDYYIWDANFNKTPATFYDGDGNGDCIVDAADYTVWYDNFNETGNADLPADFDRDGCVGSSDLTILLNYWGMPHCASRFEGDATGDGAVLNGDLTKLLDTWGDGDCGGSLMASFDDIEKQLLDAGIDFDLEAVAKKQAQGAIAQAAAPQVAKSALPPTPDANGDGVIDGADFAIIAAILAGESPSAARSSAPIAPEVSSPVPVEALPSYGPNPAAAPAPPHGPLPPYGPAPSYDQAPATPPFPRPFPPAPVERSLLPVVPEQ